MRIVLRIVVPGDRSQFRPRLQQARVGQPVTQLPMEVIVHSQQHFHAAVVVHNVVLEALSAQMHVGEETEQRRIVGKSALNFHPEIIGAGRNDESVIVQLQRDDSLLGRSLRKDNADVGLIIGCRAVGRVVHLKAQFADWSGRRQHGRWWCSASGKPDRSGRE